MLHEIIFLTVLHAFTTASKVSYENYKVFKITCETPEQIQLIKKLEGSNKGYSLWRELDMKTRTLDLMVPPNNLHEFINLASAAKTNYEVYIENVQKLIDAENPRTRKAGFGWSGYHTLDEIYNWLDEIAEKYPKKVRIIQGGRSCERRTIKGVHLRFGQRRKPGVFIEGGIHAREWISPATATYLVNEFLTSNNRSVQRLARAYEWYVFPIVNPDGYVFSHKWDRIWRKTRSKTGNPKCFGVDANRNWDYKWGEVTTDLDPCYEAYIGKSAFSEIETRTLSEYIKSIRRKLYAYISFHSYGQLLVFPYGYTMQHTYNHDELFYIGSKAIQALSTRYGTQYITGNIAKTVYLADGSSLDWVKGTLNLSVTFIYELRDTGWHGFLLPADQIIPNGEEVLDSFLGLFKTAAKFGHDMKFADVSASTPEILMYSKGVITVNLFLVYFIFENYNSFKV